MELKYVQMARVIQALAGYSADNLIKTKSKEQIYCIWMKCKKDYTEKEIIRCNQKVEVKNVSNIYDSGLSDGEIDLIMCDDYKHDDDEK